MSRTTRQISLLLLLLIAGLSAKAQLYSNDFENQDPQYAPWINLHIGIDSTASNGLYVCSCDSTMDYGLGFNLMPGKLYPSQNINLLYAFLFKTESTATQAQLVVSINGPTGGRYWNAYPLAGFVNDTTPWSKATFKLDFPIDYLNGGTVSVYIWNLGHENLQFDNAEVTLTPWTMPSYLAGSEKIKVKREKWGMLTEYIVDGDTITDYRTFEEADDSTLIVKNDLLNCQLSTVNYQLSTTFHRTAQLLRQTLVVPFSDSTLTLYRRNMAVDTAQFQPEYYLDREGFKVGEGDHTVIAYHQTGISSTQFDAVNRVAYFNLDYWRDHPMIHYPLGDTLDVFEDRSCQAVYDGMQWEHHLTLYRGDDVPNLPRIMPVPHGYAAGLIFTEHADWTDIRTHRAVLFGNENITRASNATGGFVFYGIPVTKSVFYNNPDQVTNDKISHGTFTGPICTIKTDRKFEDLLKQLYRLDYDICLHTPEQYTTTPSNLKTALDAMQRQFKSTTWIDHGYNNGLENNREDMICDGLDPQSDYYAADQWLSHGVRYLWNAYYEENRMEAWHFDCNLMQPYPGFGDALPNRQVTQLSTLNSQLSTLYTWCTPSTLEAVTDEEWDFYYSNERLQRLVDNHDVHITHIYPAWVRPGRTFWTYDADSTIIALPGMNRALGRIAAFREAHELLPMTVKTYLDYYTGLLQVDYTIVDAHHIRLTNNGENIEGFTLLCSSPIRFGDNRFYEFRKSGNYYYIWFDFKASDTVLIEIKDPVF